MRSLFAVPFFVIASYLNSAAQKNYQPFHNDTTYTVLNGQNPNQTDVIQIKYHPDGSFVDTLRPVPEGQTPRQAIDSLMRKFVATNAPQAYRAFSKAYQEAIKDHAYPFEFTDLNEEKNKLTKVGLSTYTDGRLILTMNFGSKFYMIFNKPENPNMLYFREMNEPYILKEQTVIKP